MKRQSAKRDAEKESASNKTRETLAGTPFTTAEELKRARTEIIEETWRELEKARARQQLLQKDEYRFFMETFKKGLLCKYGEDDGSLVRVFLSDEGIKIAINEDMKTTENSEALLGALIKSMSESFMANYLKALGVIPPSEVSSETDKPKKSSNKKT